MSTEESKPTEQEAQQQPSGEQVQAETQAQSAQQSQQTTEQAVAKPEAKPEVKEVKLPRPRVSLSGKLRQLLRLRLLMERREPRWMRMDEWRYLRVAHGEHWRRPRGNDNKIRLEIKGYPKRVKVGYGKPRLTRNLHPSGFKLVIVHRPEDVDKVDPAREAIVIGRTVGLRKRVEIVRRAIERGVRVINVTKDVIEELRRAQ
ncbi:50S ribosomal protein L32e [Vulcanisaeta distributa]|uniref:Large ribosomal subunit protein eL32 n=1 Tax=Vulcanisaeta distributa (strain DSM 14429 / JCM 11212 / NBRC 100878 / IC-017) TaxID=572478 RepID=E1QRG5_VULDI|nr:50S ribosomal protein L32e [Vulcanisaeta distributa]ADN51779.1 Ribosomal protein L32e [Vulcanisaeta distributa DSM 14429]